MKKIAVIGAGQWTPFKPIKELIKKAPKRPAAA